VWFTRADFAKQHAALVEGLVRGMLEAREQIDANATEVEKLMDAAFKLPSGTAATMRADAHLANYAENRAFFDPKSRTGLDSTWKLAAGTWRRANLVEARFEKSKVGDGSFVAKLGKLPAFAQQTDDYPGRLQPAGGTVDFDKHTVLTAMIVLSFFPNSSEVLKKVPDPQNPKKQVFYDQLVESTLEGMAHTAARFPHVRLEIGGHTDSSMKGTADESLVQQLSEQRANAIRQILIDRYKVDPNQLLAKGYGWSRPRAGASPTDHAANRRVELRVHAAP
jgi:outer membrane protein OmpA-like peptidoglycan-associated protein